MNDTTQLTLGEYVSVGGTTVLITGVAGNAVTVSAPVVAPSGGAVVAAIVYSLSVTNTGNATATNVALNDVLPAGSTFVTASDAGSFAAGSVTWNVGDIDPGASRSVLVTLIPGGPGAIVNTASAMCGACTIANAIANTSAGGLRIVKRTTTPVAAAGGSAIYVIDAQNTSASAIPNVSIDDTLPSGFTYASTTSIVNDGAAVAATTSPALADTVPQWGTFTIAAGKTLTLTFVANIAATVGAATYQNPAGTQPIGSTLAYDPLLSTADDVTVLAPNTGLLQGRVYQDNDNNGIYNPSVDTPLAAIGVTITDATSTVYTLTTDVNGSFSRVVATGVATVDVNDVDLPAGLVLGPGFSDPGTIAVPSGGTATRDTAYVFAASSPDLSVVKTHAGNFTQGQVGATYTITVSNVGGGPSTGQIMVTDSIPAGLSATAMSGTGWSCDVPTLTCTRSDALAASTSCPSITLTVNVAANAAAGVTNSATVSGGGDVNGANNTASDPTTITATPLAPDLSIVKAHVGSFSQGQVGATYSITVTNTGTGPSSGTVTVVDTIPAGLTATGLIGIGWSCDVPTLTCTRNDALAPSASYPSITVTVNVAANAAASVTNTVTVSGGGDSNGGNNSVSDPTTVTPLPPDLSIAKGHVGNFSQGQVGASYAITVTNIGTGPSAGVVTVVDTLPAGLTATGISGTGWGCTLATLTCARADVLAASASYPSITMTVNVAANAAASVTNSATVSGGGDSNLANNTASDPTTVTALPPDLSIAKTHVGNFSQGQTGASYAITVTNVGTGPNSGVVTVVDTLPAGLTATAISGTGWACTLATVTCTRSDVLAIGLTFPVITVTVNVAANAAASVTNSATVSGGGDSNLANNAASDPTTIAAQPPDLSITKTHVGNFSQGQTGASYAITVTNVGTGPSSGVVTVVDTLPAGLTATAISGGGWTCTLVTLTCIRSDVLAAASTYPVITVTVNVAASAAASVTNTATVSGGGDTNAANNTASDSTSIAASGAPDLVLVKTHVANFAAGQVGAAYLITVSNGGSGPTTGMVTVVDALPASLAASAIGGSGWVCTLVSQSCSRSDVLNAGASYPPITLTVNVAANAPASITNVANVSGGGDANLANNASSDVVVIADPIVIQPVPTLHEWSLALLAILLGLSGSAASRYLRRPTR